jgi:two-component system, NtrC family, response regulator AtoC
MNMTTTMTSVTTSHRERWNSGFDLPPDDIIFGRSRAMGEIRHSLNQLAGTTVPVLLQGPSGSGKEILARYIHERSPQVSGDFVKVNCPAIPGTLFESELFGYQRGAFTGAYASKPGRIEMAHRGTLFLDEVGELEPGMQAKLLQVLQDGQFSRVGAQAESQVNARFICATNRRLEQEIRRGNFRQDLFFRINVFSLELPALKDRREDIPALLDYFLERYTRIFQRPASRLSSRLVSLFNEHHWSGNIRELENLIKRFVILGSEEAICQAIWNGKTHDEADEAEMEIPSGSISLKELTRQAVRQLEKRVILNMLEANHWNRTTVSRALGISYAALLYKMREAGVPARGTRRKTEVGTFKPGPGA